MLVWMFTMMLVHGAADVSAVRAEGFGRPTPGRSTAQARLMARRAAEVVAVRNLGRGPLWRPVRTGRITWSGVVRGYRVARVRTAPDGSVTVTVVLNRR